MKIVRKNEAEDSSISVFFDEAFTEYSAAHDVALDYEEFCFAAEDDAGGIIGAVRGRAYYNEVQIGDLIVDRRFRGQDIGTKLVRAVEEAYGGRGYDRITLTTFGFQAPGFYPKLGYSLEYVREDRDPRLSKYFFRKDL